MSTKKKSITGFGQLKKLTKKTIPQKLEAKTTKKMGVTPVKAPPKSVGTAPLKSVGTAPLKSVGPAPKKIPVENFSWVNSGKYIKPEGLEEMMLPNITRFPYYVVDKYGQYMLTQDYVQDCEELKGIEGTKSAILPIFNYETQRVTPVEFKGTWTYDDTISEEYAEDWYFFYVDDSQREEFDQLITYLLENPEEKALNVDLDIGNPDVTPIDNKTDKYYGFFTTDPKLFVTTPLFPYQKFVRDFMNFDKPHRGILLYHGLGAGKTRAAIEIAKAHRSQDPKQEIVFMSPVALIDNFLQELGQWGLIPLEVVKQTKGLDTKDKRAIMARYGIYLIPYNSPKKEEYLAELTNTGKLNGKIKNKIIIIDEVHNLISQIFNKINPPPNKKKEPSPFYDLLFNCENCRLVFLSGTPMINNPTELGIMFNLLRGPLSYRDMVDLQGAGQDFMEPLPMEQIRDTRSYQNSPYAPAKKTAKRTPRIENYELFPTDKEKFFDQFVNVTQTENSLKNSDIFQRRILGLVSFYAGAKGDIFPEILDENNKIITKETFPWILEEVPMSPYQLELYEDIRSIERKEKKPKETAAAAPAAPAPKKKLIKKTQQAAIQQQVDREILEGVVGKEASSSFRVKSRQLSNFALPLDLHAIRPKNISAPKDERERAAYNNFMEQLDENQEIFFIDELTEYSPKMEKLIAKIIQFVRSGEPGNILVYSNFRSAEGLEYLARALEQNGFDYYNPIDKNPSLIKELGEEVLNNPWAIRNIILQMDDRDSIWSLCRITKEISELCKNDKEIKKHISQVKKGYTKYKFAILGRDRRAGGHDFTTEILDYYNQPDNADGSKIKILLGTANMSEGLNIFNIRQVHILEPHWNMVRIKQTIGRARRVCSHKELPKEFWNFKVYMYLATISEELAAYTQDQISTDQVIYEIAERKQIIASQFIHLMKEAAIDCILNATHNDNLTANPPINCLYYPKNIPFTKDIQYTYYPDLNDDFVYLQNQFQQWKECYREFLKSVTFTKTQIAGQNYMVILVNKATLVKTITMTIDPQRRKDVLPLYDYNVWKSSRIPHLVGYFDQTAQRVINPEEIATISTSMETGPCTGLYSF